MMIGFAPVSPKGQNLETQRAALGAAGCVSIFEEDDLTGQRDRPELTRMLDHLRAGDVVTVTRLDRLARSRPELLAIAVRIKQADAGLRSLAETWADTTTPDGSEMLTVLAGIVAFERSLIAERTSTGRIEARAHGVKFGRPPILSVEQTEHARQLINEDNKPRGLVLRQRRFAPMARVFVRLPPRGAVFVKTFRQPGIQTRRHGGTGFSICARIGLAAAPMLPRQCQIALISSAK